MADQVACSVRSLPLPPAQLLVYRFGREAEFEGRLVGAPQRIKSGGALRILDALFVRCAAKTGELDAVAVRREGAGRIVVPLLELRLDPRECRRATERALGGDRGAAVRGDRRHAGGERVRRRDRARANRGRDKVELQLKGTVHRAHG